MKREDEATHHQRDGASGFSLPAARTAKPSLALALDGVRVPRGVGEDKDGSVVGVTVGVAWFSIAIGTAGVVVKFWHRRSSVTDARGGKRRERGEGIAFKRGHLTPRIHGWQRLRGEDREIRRAKIE